jgi:triosephosphate isomerase (TIM)
MNNLVIGNLKMNIVSKVERNNYFKSFRESIRGRKIKETSIVLCPPNIHLETFIKTIKNKNVSFGAQNAYWENAGSFTGKVSSAMVKNIGASYQIAGHSERRTKFGETNEDVNRKIGSAFRNKLIPVMCVGESSVEKEAEETKEVISTQIKEGLEGMSKVKISKMVIAYEPIWSIGSGKVPTGEEIMGVRILIQKILADKFDLTIKQMPRILYGGSVNYRNVKDICLGAGMNGVLVGGESLHPVSFLKIVDVLEENN